MPHVQNYTTLLRKLDHYALPRLVQEHLKDDVAYLITESNIEYIDSKPVIKSLYNWTIRHRSLFQELLNQS